MPGYLAGVSDVFRLNADGVSEACWHRDGDVIVIDSHASRVSVHVATSDTSLRGRMEATRQSLIAKERATGFDPAGSDTDFARLAALLQVPVQ